ncbi:hypothetical protein GE061_006504 [Apolygus lucorum]|uniref:Uncharacterized protein n=1 Tax=Apolygus lucorum TaxID=248454 RepID=A0A8S9WVT4_APOLU|nr:hypothetical protein GE061_006504 [Apolygus lucorum]
MSLITNRERTYKCKTQKGVKKMSSGRMKSASSFADPRAWSSNPRKRTEYIFEAMAELASSSGGEDSKDTSEDSKKPAGRNSLTRRHFLMNKGSFFC